MDYQLSDFVLFSADVYLRLVQQFLANGQLTGMVLSAMALSLVFFRSQKARHIAVGFTSSVALIWLGWQFYIIEYMSINWFALYPGMVCLLLSILYIVWALNTLATPAADFSKKSSDNQLVINCIVIYTVVVRPMMMTEMLTQMPLTSVGLIPIPTLLLAFGLTLAINLPGRLVLLAILLGLLLFESLTLFLLNIVWWQEVPVIVVAVWVIAYSSNKMASKVSY